MTKQCIQCNNEFEAARDTAKYCSDACRVAYNRDHSEVLPTVDIKPEPQKIAAVSEKVASANRLAEKRAADKWGGVCSLEQWKLYPNMCETKAQAKAVHDLYDTYSAEELAAAGVLPPKWKKNYKTYAEMRAALTEDMAKFKLIDLDEKIDYSTWK